MAMQKFVKMKKYKVDEHEAEESPAFEKAEEKMDKKHFAHEGIENISEHRQKYYTKGKHAINHRENGGK